jgi:hypothetical protein
MNISVIESEKNTHIDLANVLNGVFYKGEIDKIIEFIKCKHETPNIAMLILEELLMHDWIYPVVTRDSSKLIMINQRLRLGYDQKYNLIMIGEKEQIGIHGLVFNTELPPDKPESVITRKYTYIDVYMRYFFKRYFKDQLDLLNTKRLFKFGADMNENLVSAKLIHSCINYFSSMYMNREEIDLYISQQKLNPVQAASSEAAVAFKFNEKQIAKIQDKLLWVKFTSRWELALFCDLYNMGWSREWEILMMSQSSGLETQIQKYNARITNLYYVDVDALLMRQLNKTARDIEKINKFNSVTTKEALVMQREFNELMVLPDRANAYRDFMKRWKLEDSDIDYIYDSNFNIIFCPHMKCRLTGTDIEQYYVYLDKKICCKICGEILLELGKWGLNYLDEVYFYTDINFDIKYFIWKEIIKILTFVKYKKAILVQDFIMQVTEIIFPALRDTDKKIHLIKTMKLAEKYMYFKVYANVFIWVLLLRIRLHYKDIYTFIFEEGRALTHDMLYEKLLVLIDYSKNGLMDERKFRILYSNIINDVAKSPIQDIVFRENNPLLLYYEPNVNSIYKFMHAVNRKHNRDLESFEPIKDEPVWNNFISYISYITKHYISDSFISNRRQDKTAHVRNIFFAKYEKVPEFYPAPFDVNHIRVLYGLTDEKVFHRHKWNKVLCAPVEKYKGFGNISTLSPISNRTIAVDYRCGVCNKTLSQQAPLTMGSLLSFQAKINFYNIYFVLCLKSGVHEFVKGQCKKCAITVQDILTKSDAFFESNKEIISKKRVTNTISYKKDDFAVVAKNPKKNYINDFIQLVNKLVLASHKDIPSLKQDAYYEFMLNLGSSSSGDPYARSIVCHSYMQSMNIVLYRNDSTAGTVYADSNYTELRMKYEPADLQYILLMNICETLLQIKNKDCLLEIIQMFYNYESKQKAKTTLNIDINVFDVKTISEEIGFDEEEKSIYDNMDFEETAGD